eukprot:5262986-Amphidinium_carterae.1
MVAVVGAPPSSSATLQVMQYANEEVLQWHQLLQVVAMLMLLVLGLQVWYRRHYKAVPSLPEEKGAATCTRVLQTLGPGLMVCLADSDIGGLATMAEAGSKTGYALMSLQLILIPVLYAVQEMVVRLSVHR